MYHVPILAQQLHEDRIKEAQRAARGVAIEGSRDRRHGSAGMHPLQRLVRLLAQRWSSSAVRNA